jgi:hypothetical protein
MCRHLALKLPSSWRDVSLHGMRKIRVPERGVLGAKQDVQP